jgi:DNA processing protein
MQKVIDAGGLILSEFKLDQQPQTYTYPQRNRIVAGLADVVFLPEAGKKSGSLITAEFAFQMHKPVYGVPNSLFSVTSEGVNDAIAEGKIHMVTDFSLFLDQYFPQDQAAPTRSLPENLTPQEQEVVTCIQQKELCSLSDIMLYNKSSPQETIAMLTLLEMKQCIYQETPGVYRMKS